MPSFPVTNTSPLTTVGDEESVVARLVFQASGSPETGRAPLTPPFDSSEARKLTVPAVPTMVPGLTDRLDQLSGGIAQVAKRSLGGHDHIHTLERDRRGHRGPGGVLPAKRSVASCNAYTLPLLEPI